MKHRVIERNRHCTKEDLMSGTVTYQADWVGVHPSICAASMRDLETLIKPAT